MIKGSVFESIIVVFFVISFYPSFNNKLHRTWQGPKCGIVLHSAVHSFCLLKSDSITLCDVDILLLFFILFFISDNRVTITVQSIIQLYDLLSIF